MRRLVGLSIGMAVALVAGQAAAFHDGGVAHCDGCHTMHNSANNAAVIPGSTQFTGRGFLLKGSDASSTCLNCHARGTQSSYAAMTYPVPAVGVAPAQMSPGGDFAYLGKTYTWTAHGSTRSTPGERHGHNIVAQDFGLTADTVLTTAPGGNYAANQLGCNSCHDPHGKTRILSNGTQDRNVTIGTASEPIRESGSYGAMPTAGEAVGVYRLLGGQGYVPATYSGGPTFNHGAPTAVTPSGYNRSEGTTETRVAYGQGMSEWCANCHASIHANNLGTLRHPAGNGATLGGYAANYNAYVASGNLTGTQATSYSSLVPYEEGTGDRAALVTRAVNDGSQTTGPNTGNENVMCLTCHRAHASAFSSMGRWDFGATFVTENGAYTADAEGGGKTAAENQAAYYDRPATAFATFQRSLCNKCHTKD